MNESPDLAGSSAHPFGLGAIMFEQWVRKNRADPGLTYQYKSFARCIWVYVELISNFPRYQYGTSTVFVEITGVFEVPYYSTVRLTVELIVVLYEYRTVP